MQEQGNGGLLSSLKGNVDPITIVHVLIGVVVVLVVYHLLFHR